MKLNQIKIKVKNRIHKFIIVIFKLFFFPLKPKNNKVVLVNYHGNAYGDNLKYIAENLLKYKSLELVWLLKKELSNEVDFPPGIRVAYFDTISGLYEMATSKVWISNCRNVFCSIKKNNQYYIQTWHGGIALKRIEGDAENLINKYYIKCAKRDAKYTDLMVSNSGFCTNMYKRAFWYNGEIIECGSPRNDILIQQDKKKIYAIREKLNIEEDEKVILYAPTFRNEISKNPYIEDFNKIEESFKILLGKSKKIKILVRLHPNISSYSKNIIKSKNIINVTDYPDMQELLLISDYLISDYSSSVFEFSLMYKPVFLYMNDYDDYLNQRGLYFLPEQLPYNVSYSMNELLNKIENFDKQRYDINLNMFFEEVKIKENGRASEEITNRILNIINSK